VPDVKDRRWKILHVDPNEILLVLRHWRTASFVYRLTGGDIPEDAVVVDLQADWYRKTIALRLWSASFPEVKDGDGPCNAIDT
jgi:hypothetical protein